MIQIRRVIFTFFVFINISTTAKLPTTFQRCKVSPELDGKPNECLIEAVGGAIKLLVPGIRELGALPLDPLTITEMKIEKGGDGPFSMKLVYSNCLLTGLKNTKVLNVSGKLSSPDNFLLKMDVLLPSTQMKGPYNLKGRILALPIDGHGESDVIMYNTKYHIEFEAEKRVRNYTNFLKMKNVKFSMERPENLKVHLGNLFNGDKELGETTNRFLNDNWRDIYLEMKEPFTNALRTLFKEYSRPILESVPYNDVFIVE